MKISIPAITILSLLINDASASPYYTNATAKRYVRLRNSQKQVHPENVALSRRKPKKSSVIGRTRASDKLLYAQKRYDNSIPIRLYQYVRSIASGLLELPRHRQREYLSSLNVEKISGLTVFRRKKDNMYVIKYKEERNLIELLAMLDKNNASEFSHNIQYYAHKVEAFAGQIVIRREKILKIQSIIPDETSSEHTTNSDSLATVVQKNHWHILSQCPDSRYAIYQNSEHLNLKPADISSIYIRSLGADILFEGTISLEQLSTLSTDDITFLTDDSGNTWYEQDGTMVFVDYYHCAKEKSYVIGDGGGGGVERDRDGRVLEDVKGLPSSLTEEALLEKVVKVLELNGGLMEEQKIKEYIDSLANSTGKVVKDGNIGVSGVHKGIEDSVALTLKERNKYIPRYSKQKMKKMKRKEEKKRKKKEEQKYIFNFGEDSSSSSASSAINLSCVKGKDGKHGNHVGALLRFVGNTSNNQ